MISHIKYKIKFFKLYQSPSLILMCDSIWHHKMFVYLSDTIILWDTKSKWVHNPIQSHIHCICKSSECHISYQIVWKPWETIRLRADNVYYWEGILHVTCSPLLPCLFLLSYFSVSFSLFRELKNIVKIWLNTFINIKA